MLTFRNLSSCNKTDLQPFIEVASIFERKFVNCNFEKVDFADIVFGSSYFKNYIFNDSIFRKNVFSSCSFEKSDFTGSYIDTCKFELITFF